MSAAVAFDVSEPIRMAQAGELIRRARRALRMSQEVLGDKLGVSQRTISHWENTSAIPSKHVEQLETELELVNGELRVELEASGREAISASDYVTHTRDIERWRSQVLLNTSNMLVASTLMTFPMYMHPNGEAHVAEDRIAADAPYLTLQQVQDAWKGVLESPHVERVGAARWVFRLRLIEEL